MVMSTEQRWLKDGWMGKYNKNEKIMRNPLNVKEINVIKKRKLVKFFTRFS